ncbi:MAG: hypothetical protein IPM46_10195 [Flavobacteriales bacterium]|nr:hypothetical protein [Flavobacteriales bacterium]
MELPNLTNYAEHPTEPGWLIFRFREDGQAAEFVQLLQADGLRHERDTEGGPPYMVAVKQHHRSVAVRLNYIVLGRHRKPFLADAVLRWGVIALVTAIILLALVGALLRP